MFKLITKNVIHNLDSKSYRKYQTAINNINKQIDVHLLEGTDMMGWKNLVTTYAPHDLALMRSKAREWKKLNLKHIVVIGIGGSYVGVKAALDMCCGVNDPDAPKIVWIHNIASDYVLSIRQKLSREKFGIVIISKSGTTLEPAVGFRIFRELLQKNVGLSKLHKYIVAITDKEKGTLHEYAKNRHIPMFYIPNDIGGRFSTLTPVGMFLMILKGMEPLQLFKGVQQALKDAQHDDIHKNMVYQYASLRHYLHTTLHYQIENFIVYDPSIYFVGEMWRQIFGESEGKHHRGLFPAISLFTTDLHSMGQYFQDGTRNFFETTLIVDKPRLDIKLKIFDDVDKLKYLNNKSLDYINKKAFQGTIAAHTREGRADNIILQIDKADEYHFGYLFMFFALSVTLSGYLLKVNPFNQPGVEQYKQNMFRLLGKKH